MFKKNKYKVVKFYKIVDLKQSKDLNIHKIIDETLLFIFSNYGKYPNDLEINYGKKTWKSKERFDIAIAKMNQSKIFNFIASFQNSESYVIIGNSILNIIKSHIPKKSITRVELVIPSSSVDNDVIISYANTLYNFFQFDYAYILELTDNYDFHTERKKKRGFFGSKVKTNEIERTWNFHSVGVNYGFVKNIYPINFLNKSQINQPIISKCLKEKIGYIKSFNDTIDVWFLNENEINLVLNYFRDSKYVIGNKDYYKNFLKSDEAKQFNEMMKFANNPL